MSHNFYSDRWSRQKASSCSDPNSLHSTGPFEEPGMFYFFSSRSESRSRIVGCRECSVVEDMRLCVLTKDLPHCDSYTRNRRIATTSGSVSRRKQRRFETGDHSRSILSHHRSG